MEQKRAPLFTALCTHAERAEKGNFHVPGHKEGQAYDLEGEKYFAPLLALDMTELPHLDDLHHPAGVIAESQQLAASAFGAKHTFFLVGGSTAGNLAAILCTMQRGDQLLVPRNAHQSVFHACILAGVRPIYIGAEIDEGTGLCAPIEVEQLEVVYTEYPDVKGLLLTSPHYNGMYEKVEEVAIWCRQKQLLLLVDEAHGAHFPFHKELPLSAVQCGADVVVQSTHKMLPAMTMSSMLHLGSNRVSPQEIQRWLRIIQSSSPSYPLMASLDLARRWMVERGETELERVIGLLTQLRTKLSKLSYLRETSKPYPRDPFKLLLETTTGVTGYALAQLLEERGCYCELADPMRVLIVCSAATLAEELDLLWKSLLEIDSIVQKNSMKRQQRKCPTLKNTAALPLDQLTKAPTEKIALIKASGRVAAETVIPYPPGIPVLLPGEEISVEMVDYLVDILQAGGQVRGLTSVSTPLIDVVK
ncbi:aminotransferase class I/II-fold pyridoxal phosphate-dependent enzyme [Mechercharimyces sp. CAU 1602]|uniref:aminotransferase class I/II-fold pyridoxal phosphate-dependent enzyme n=1 Tax=Mechercharimyces sp. CAU 1602 TaxID=2973933 RepID=UPI0021631025|nr:aminotransferase class I/II-fold pyridoxal phosphate-dependent enzyme [Mechercharimyces sp. CAU 1602]MCS1352354.1 aminotransferase class I/II-fold pyridoxal phosphate-dependent enzyme [Mechercharimyces sp. CAU 1602]